MIRDYPDPPRPGPFGRWLTEIFNTWPEGARPELPTEMTDQPAVEISEELREESTTAGG
jgi:hypothetical protein